MADSAEAVRQVALGIDHFNRGNLAMAAACFRLAVAADPGSAEAHARLAWAIADQENFDEALEHLHISARLNPGSIKVFQALAQLHKRKGEMEEAVKAYERAVALEPNSANSLVGLVNCKTIVEGDRPLLERLVAMHDQPGRSVLQRQQIQYAVGRGYDSLKEYGTAIGHYDEANRLGLQILRESGRVFMPDSLARHVDSLKARFTPAFFEQGRSVGSDSEIPVLIVGMIRSGTTLLDVVLSCHPEIDSAGELRYWRDEVPAPFSAQLIAGRVDGAKAAELASEYRRLLRRLGPGKPRVIDKMPMNYLLLGTIHLLMPNARIIHCRRHPVDTALSIWTTPFGAPQPEFAFDRRNIVSMYRQYQSLMDHWRAVLPPDRFLEVDYEAIVSDREAVARQCLEFLGLEWNEACLHHESSKSFVNTPSLWQVRQPIYSSSVERWRRYEPWLGEFKELLPEG